MVGGAADITSSGSTLTVTTSTDKAVIDWRGGFNIGVGETTRFNLPSSSAIVLNKDNTGNPSLIQGALTSNGNVMILNQNGVIFGAHSTVDVNGLIATTSDIDNDDFMQGNLRFKKSGNPNASVENHGIITAREAGLVGLVAPNVINSGTINARLGRVQLASGDSFTLDLYGDDLMEVKVSDAVQAQLVRNTGVINAEGGVIKLTAAAGAQAVNSLIEVGGELNARGIAEHEGKIVIFAEGSNAVADPADKGTRTGSSTVRVTGTLDVSNTTGKGGTIQVLGDHVELAPTAVLNANGANGGGTIHIGGDFAAAPRANVNEGAETTTPEEIPLPAAQVAPVVKPIPASLSTMIAQGALVSADATESGDGGKVSVWADERTTIGGRISADANNETGNGGFIETSGGRVAIEVNAGVTASSRRRRAGTWLLDPADIIITNADSAISGGPNYTPTNTASTIDVATIVTALLTTDVTITTTNDGFAGNGDITVSSAITSGTNHALTLSAYRNIAVDAAITTQGGAVTLRANNAGVGAGTVSITQAITTNGGNITIGGGAGAITAGAGYAEGGVVTSAAVDAAGGNILINGRTAAAASGVRIGAALGTSGTGTITLNGISGTGVDSLAGVDIRGNITSVDGAISITGLANAASTSSTQYGVWVGSGKTVQATGTGAVTVTGTGGGAAGSGLGNNGVFVDQGFIRGHGGAVNVTGTAGASSGGNDRGVVVQNGTISNTGSGTLNVTGHGAGVGNGNSNQGVFVFSGGRLTTVDGALTVVGTGANTNGGGADSLNHGVYLLGGTSAITTTGTGTINVTGTGGNGVGGTNHGITVENGSILGNGGAMTIDGTGAASDGADNYGVYVVNSSGNGISNIGTGTLSVTGHGGAGVSSRNYGVLAESGGKIITADGALTVNGFGGGSGGAFGFNSGVYVTGAGSTIKTTGSGNLAVNGTGGVGTSNDHGIFSEVSGGLTTSGAGSMTLSGTAGGGANSVGLLANTVGSVTTTGTGDITVLANSVLLGAAGNISSARNLAIAPLTAAATMSIGTTGSTLNLSNNDLNYITAASYSFGAANTGDMTINTTKDFGDANVTFRSGRDITLAGTLTKAAGTTTNITLAAARNFINTATTAFNVTAGRWLAYSTTPANSPLNGLTSNFVRYGCTYGGSCPTGVTIPTSGNGVIYSARPTLTITPTASISYYDAAPTLVGYSYGIAGYLTSAAGNDSTADALTGALTGTTTYTQGNNAGSYSINYASGTLASTLGYDFTYANNATGLTVNKVLLTGTVASQTIVGGTAIPASTVSYSGLRNNETAAVIDTPATVLSARNGAGVAGSYAGNYTASGAVDNNYSFTYIAGDLLVTAAPAATTTTTRVPSSVEHLSQPQFYSIIMPTLVFSPQGDSPLVMTVTDTPGRTPTGSNTSYRHNVQNDTLEIEITRPLADILGMPHARPEQQSI
ncbi:MAG: filamentous hemagglutinin N-terminal domain-containing protein [Pseudomonadota bacterium]